MKFRDTVNELRPLPARTGSRLLAGAVLCSLILLGCLAFTTQESRYPFTVPDDYHKLPSHALIITTKGLIEIKFHREQAPVSVANFAFLAKTDRYEGIPFHDYKPGFVIQSGDLTHTKQGQLPYTLPPEIGSDILHVPGTIGWTRLPPERNPERRNGGSEFYICLSRQPNLDRYYTAFAVVSQGMQNVMLLREGDKILKVKLHYEKDRKKKR